MFNVTRGRQTAAIKGLLYGVPGIGKTTFAAKWPGALFLDVEGSSEQLDNDDISRVDPTPTTYQEFISVIDQIAVNSMGFKTLVIDTADWLESMMIRQICQDAGCCSIETYGKGYGKGWTKVCETWSTLLDKLERIRKGQGMNILFVAHSRIRKFEPADDIAYDRYTLSQNEKSGDILKKWADIILFTKHSVLVTENEDGKIKAHSNGKRMMYTTFNPCWDAKNRFGLPESIFSPIGDGIVKTREVIDMALKGVFPNWNGLIVIDQDDSAGDVFADTVRGFDNLRVMTGRR